jgi:hypothetical protein
VRRPELGWDLVEELAASGSFAVGVVCCVFAGRVGVGDAGGIMTA